MEVFRISHYRWDDFETCDYFVKPQGKTINEIKAIVDQAKENYLASLNVFIPDLPFRCPYAIETVEDDSLTIGELKQQIKDWHIARIKRKEMLDQHPETFKEHLAKLGIEEFDSIASYDDSDITLTWTVSADITVKY